MQLDFVKVTEDLEPLIIDSIKPFNYFFSLVKAKGYEENILRFLDHALLLLAELKSEKSLPFTLEKMKQDETYIEQGFSNFDHDTMGKVLYHCGRNQTESLFEFFKLPNIPPLAKARVVENLAKIITDSTKDRTFFIEKFRNILHWFRYNIHVDHNDTESVAYIIHSICHLGYHEFLPEIKQLYDLQLVGTWFCGSYKKIKKDIQKPRDDFSMSYIRLDIFEKYKMYREWAMDLLHDELLLIYAGEVLEDLAYELDQLPRKLVPLSTA